MLIGEMPLLISCIAIVNSQDELSAEISGIVEFLMVDSTMSFYQSLYQLILLNLMPMDTVRSAHQSWCIYMYNAYELKYGDKY